MKVTITADLDDSAWGFSRALKGMDKATKEDKLSVILSLLFEDVEEVVGDATWDVDLDSLKVKEGGKLDG